uniref:Uncharacterized protein n=1 Tax=Panagrolaimus sp. PS1159 TaxID=55785 RepID=A0AC35EUE9_9BILA
MNLKITQKNGGKNIDHQLFSLWDVNKSIVDYNNIPLQLFFGKYNATGIFNAADAENGTAALIVLINNAEFVINISKETNLFNFTSTTKCEQIFLCNIIHKFLNTPRDPLTKLNFVFVSNICPDSSLLKEFYNFGKETGYNSTKTYLISNSIEANNETCKNKNLYLSHQFIPNFNDINYSFKADTKLLADPRFGKFFS